MNMNNISIQNCATNHVILVYTNSETHECLYCQYKIVPLYRSIVEKKPLTFLSSWNMSPLIGDQSYVGCCLDVEMLSFIRTFLIIQFVVAQPHWVSCSHTQPGLSLATKDLSSLSSIQAFQILSHSFGDKSGKIQFSPKLHARHSKTLNLVLKTNPYVSTDTVVLLAYQDFANCRLDE